MPEDWNEHLAVLRESLVVLPQLVERVGPDRLRRAPAPGEWSVHVVVCHLVLTEMNTTMSLRLILTQDHPALCEIEDDRCAEAEGHAIACGDLLGAGYDQIVIGWRGKNDDGKVGIKLFVPLDPEAKTWQQTVLDDSTMACEDLCLADLNGDGKLDIVASGRATKNVKVYFNQGAR